VTPLGPLLPAESNRRRSRSSVRRNASRGRVMDSCS